MKKLALMLLVIMFAALGTALYLRVGAQLIVAGASVGVRGAHTDADAWASLYVELTDGTFQGRVLSEADMTNAEDYEFRTYSVRLRNLGMLKAEWISISVRAEEADVIEYGESRGFTLAAFSSGTISGTVLSRAGSDAARVVTVRYYVFGRPFTVETLVR
ncbi:MAG: hypothetical protein LBS72_10115 [Oscillospiraceae bacterium]|jgi:hypothetical protein|nr:hypothetical protein [Oscillospiraceae bacterium]